jgi:hypothetical protein
MYFQWQEKTETPNALMSDGERLAIITLIDTLFFADYQRRYQSISEESSLCFTTNCVTPIQFESLLGLYSPSLAAGYFIVNQDESDDGRIEGCV